MKKSLYTLHKEAWLGCTRCLLHEHRRKVVLCRGQIPADVLFVGEAPGESEDVLGSPFVGPAGQLLDDIISRAFGGMALDTGEGMDDKSRGIRWAFTNLVGCIPHNESGDKYDVPKAAIQECRPRLVELCKLVKPKLVVWVGALAEKHWNERLWEIHLPKLAKPRFVRIDHPARILRSGVQDRGLMIQKCEAVLEDAVLDLFNPT